MGDLVFLGSPTLGPRMGMRKGTSALAHYERGCELEASDPDGAMAAYRRALAGRPDLADAHFNLARQIERVARQADDEIMLRRAVRHLKQYRDLSRASG